MRDGTEGNHSGGEHYYSERPAVGSAPRTVRLDLPDLALSLATDAGVFSADRVDPGSKLLLLTAPPPPPSGDLLDLGCGYGPLALTMASRSPEATVWAVDVNERARDLCARNAQAAGLAHVRVVAPAEVPADVRFAAIWSNPPIRIGKPALHELLSSWLGRLDDGAPAHLVVQRHPGADSLGRWLEREGFVVRRLASRQAYRVLEAQRDQGR
jgi:16S rRNA (guanine1207-N2)-methyltransferase